MRQPIWIINSSILALLIILEGVVFIFHTPTSRRVSLKPSAIKQSEVVAEEAINIEQIYVNDLFNTYVHHVQPGKPLITNQVPDIPAAPHAVPIHIPEIEQPTFVAPLDVTLKGVMFLADDQLNSVAVVQNNSVKTEANYRVGEFIEDAQVLKMFSDKVLVIRSNGQQEMLYLREEDAAQDLKFEDRSTVQSDVVFMMQDNFYSVNVAKFIQKVSNLGQFIDMLGLITVYDKGQASGCRVGAVGDKSLGQILGLQEGDVIEKVNNISITDLNSRVNAYNEIIQKSVGDAISINVRRDSQVNLLMYNLVDEAGARILADKYAVSSSYGSDSVNEDLIDTLSRSNYEVEKERLGILSRKVAMAPTQKQIEEEEMKNLMKAYRASDYRNT